MIHAKMSEIYEMVCSKKFIIKVFAIDDKNNIKKYENGKKITFDRPYNYKDLYAIESIKVPDNFTTMIENNLNNVELYMYTEHEIIKHTDTSFIVKYTSILKKPDYINAMLKNTKIILYVQFKTNTRDPNMTVVHYNKKLLNADEEDNDSLIIDASNNDIITNIYQQETLKINESIISISETFLGHNFVHDFCIPFINNIFNTSFSILQDVYTVRMMKYMSKKNIEIYKKKDS
jgi:hypothetical protein